MVIPSGPGAPRFAFTFCHAWVTLAWSTTASIRDSGNKLKAGFSIDADVASSGRTVEPVVFTRRLPGNLPAGWREGFPRVKSIEGSSLFFIPKLLENCVLRVVIGIDSSLLRPLLTPTPPESVFTGPFQAFRQALLAGASTTRKSSMQVSPDKDMNLPCASSPFTKSINRVRLCSVWPTRPLTRPSRTFLYVASQIW